MIKKEELMEFIEWMAGSLSPISHPDYYELNITDNNFFYQTERYFEEKRKELYQYKGKDLLNVIRIIIEESISKEEFDELWISKKDFHIEFGCLLAIFQDTEEGNALLKIVHKKLLKAEDKLLYLEILSYLHNPYSIQYIAQLQFEFLNETELISTISALHEIGTAAAQALIKKIGNLEYLKKHLLFMEEFKIVCALNP